MWPLGDSLTFGTLVPASTELTSPGGYRSRLDALLIRAGIAHRFVGTSDGGNWLAGLPGRPRLAPDIATIMLGTNDIEQRFDPQTRFPTVSGLLDVSDPAQVATFVADLTARLGQIVDAIERDHPGIAIVLSDVPPFSRYLVDQVTGRYAFAVAGLVARQRPAGRNIVFGDVYARFTEPGALSLAAVRPGLIGPDGIHPSPTGYGVMADVLAQSLERLECLG